MEKKTSENIELIEISVVPLITSYYFINFQNLFHSTQNNNNNNKKLKIIIIKINK